MDIKYCFKCRSKIAPNKGVTHFTDEGLHRDYCPPCWAFVNANGKLGRKHDQSATERKKRAPGSSSSFERRRRSDSSLHELMVSQAKEREKRKTIKSHSIPSSPSTQRNQSAPKSNNPTARRQAAVARSKRKQQSALRNGIIAFICLLLMSWLFFLTMNAASNEAGSQQVTADIHTKASFELVSDWERLLKKEFLKELSPKRELQELKRLLKLAEGTELHTPISIRIEVIEKFLMMRALIQKDVLKIKAIYELYTQLAVIREIGPWEEMIESTWTKAAQSWEEKTKLWVEQEITAAINTARKSKEYTKAFSSIDRFLNSVEECDGIAHKWRTLVAQEKEALEAFKKRSNAGR